MLKNDAIGHSLYEKHATGGGLLGFLGGNGAGCECLKCPRAQEGTAYCTCKGPAPMRRSSAALGAAWKRGWFG